MIRAPLGEQRYWDKWVAYSENRTRKMLAALDQPSKNSEYDPQYSFDAAIEHLELLAERYSRGDPIRDLAQVFPGLLDAWELSNRLATEICIKHGLKTCRDWIFELSNLNHYNWCFWLAGLALTLEISEDQWRRLLALIGGEGTDELLDRVIASRQPGRRIGSALLHPKPYVRLLKAIDAPPGEQAVLLREFVDHWYPELARKGKDELWWYIYGDPVKNPLENGSYFGRWCIEAAVAVKLFGLDDSRCLGHEYYPGDLLRPEGPTTHPLRKDAPAKSGLWSRLFG